ncbi:hypothetical protein [Streptomyces sp. NPDC051219]|uniref:hypothetical protein n=1 Tax=Streptomyces sp. NPDC051219 TaxID=3155283 RepID=UPI0034318893
MKRSGPLFTLLAGLLLGLFMLSLNATTGTKTSSYGEGTETGASPSPSAPAAAGTPSSTTPTTTPSVTPTATPSVTPPGKPPPDAEYSGRTEDDTAAVAVSLRDGKAIAYFCDGRSVESWLRGDVQDDGSMRLTGRNGATLEGTLSGGRIEGTVEISGKSRQFTAPRADKPGGSLYRATAEVGGAKLDGGWIVLPDGRQVGILKRDGDPAPAPRIDPRTGSVTIDGQQLTARPAVP